ncbi:tripartite tricarboxylate transporter substrate binding protein [Paraburkholderia strydomiana]|uniref:Tripartite tricarboxylate transporter substrate binding protein n=1 Tax=Paraburkholderia strydomiana TaxID=1245417 RepID=A0ABW9EE85_9BURK
MGHCRAMLVALCIGFAGAAHADDYPQRAVTIVVPYAPGGAGDLTTRVFAQKMTQRSGQPVIVLNRPGAGFANSATVVAHSRADGYTVFLGGNGVAISSVLFRNLPYRMSDFRQVSTVAFFSLVVLVDQSSPFRSVADLVAYAKSHPGKLNVATVSTGSTQNLVADLIKARAGVDMQIVPFQTTSEVTTALRGKDVQVAVELIPSVLGQVRAGVVRALAVTSAQRFAGLPQVPTLAESGLAGFDATSWSGLSVPAKTDEAVVQRLAALTQAVLADPDVQQKMRMLGAVAQSSTPQHMSKLVDDDTARWQRVIGQAGIPLH